jgi:hypothetical protein
MAWGLLWWFGAGLDEIDRRLSRRHELIGSLAYMGLNGMAMGMLFRRLDWKGMRWPAMGLLPVMVLAAAALYHQYDVTHPFQGGWIIAWPTIFVIHVYLLRCMDTAWNEKVAVGWHVAGALLATGLVGWEAGWLMDQLADGSRVWSFIAWGVVPAAVVTLLIRFRAQAGWPFTPWANAYRGWLPSLLVLGLLAGRLSALP